MTVMALIDARDRFAARRSAAGDLIDIAAAREAARTSSGRFGEQHHSAPGITLDEALDSVGALDSEDAEAQQILDRPAADNYSGTPEEREAQRFRREFNSLLLDAGIDSETLPARTREEIEHGLIREGAQRESARLYKERQKEERANLPAGERARKDAYDELAELRGGVVSYQERKEIERIVADAQRDGTLNYIVEETRAQVLSSRAQRAEHDRAEQIEHLGPLTTEVWDEALRENTLRAQERIRRLRPTLFHDLKSTNQYLRATLATVFPGVKFSVRGDSYAGGASTNVAWTDGPTEAQVNEVLAGFVGSAPDHSGDYWDPVQASGFDENNIPVKHSYRTDHIFGRREYSDETSEHAMAIIARGMSEDGDTAEFSVNRHYAEPPQWLYRLAREAGVLDDARHRPFSLDRLDGYQIRRAVEELTANGKMQSFDEDKDYFAFAMRPHAIKRR